MNNKTKKSEIIINVPSSNATITSAKARRNRRKKNRQSTSQSNVGKRNNNSSPAMRSWIDSLNDPFTHQGPLLGYGTLQPSTKATAYYKATIACSSDGYLGFFALPMCGGTTNCIYYNQGVSGSTTWTASNYNNSAVIANQGAEARVISGAIRVLPLLAATSVPGIITVGSIPSVSANQITTASNNFVMSLPFGQVGLATNGALVNSRPVDDSSFIFSLNTLNGSTTVIPTWSVPYFVLSGCPAATSVFVEVAMNIEIIGGVASTNATALDGEQVNPSETLAGSIYSTAEQAFRAARGYITPAAILSAAHEFASSGSPYASVSAGMHAMNSHSAHRRTAQPAHNMFTIEDVE